jgi:hypothetical protein
LTLNIAAGTAICGNPPVKVDYAGGTLTMTNAATNYVYLDPVASCVPAKNTTGFTAGVIPVAQVAAAGGVITGVTDVRTWFVDPNSYGPVCRADLMPGADAGAKIAACWAAMPVGGTTDARGLPGAQTVSSTVFLDKPGTLLLGDGPYTLPTTGGTAVTVGGAAFYASANNVRIIGNGQTVLQAARTWADGSWAAVGAFGVSGFEARNLDIQITVTGAMPGVQTNIQGVWVKGAPTTGNPAASNFTIENNRVWAHGAVTDELHGKLSGIFVYSQHVTLRATGGIIKGNILTDCHGRNIYLYRATGVSIIGNTITDLGSTLAGVTSAAKGIRVIGGTSVSILGNTISSAGSAGDLRAISLEGDTANINLSVVGNTVYFSGTQVASVGLWAENTTWADITGNSLTFAGADSGANSGVRLYTNAGALPVNNMLLAQNLITGWRTYQIYVQDSSVSDVHIVHNLLGKSIAGVENYYYVAAGAARINYSGNVESTNLGLYSRLAEDRLTAGLLVGSAATAAGHLARFQQYVVSPTGGQSIVDTIMRLKETATPNANPITVLNSYAYVGGDNTQNWTGDITTTQASVQALTGATGIFSNVHAFQAGAAPIAATTWTNYYGFRARAPAISGTGAITNLWSFKGEVGAGIAEIADGIRTAKSIISGVNTVTFSATPTFNASLGNTQKITLTGNVTSSTLSNAGTGQSINFIICQDATGSRTFVWPTTVKGGMTIGSTLSTCSAQDFIFDGTNAYAVSSGVTNM